MFRTVGHDKAVKALTRAIDNDAIAHAYLLAGPPQIGKMTLAMDIVRAINCVADEQPNMFGETEPKPCNTCGSCDRITRGLHTDVRVVTLGQDSRGRTQTLISIDQVREVQREASLRPSEGKYRVFIFDRAEYLSQGAADGAAQDSGRAAGPGDLHPGGDRQRPAAPHDLITVPDLQAASHSAVGDRRTPEVRSTRRRRRRQRRLPVSRKAGSAGPSAQSPIRRSWRRSRRRSRRSSRSCGPGWKCASSTLKELARAFQPRPGCRPRRARDMA